MGMFDFLKKTIDDNALRDEVKTCKLRVNTLEAQNLELAKRVRLLQDSLKQTQHILNCVSLAHQDLARDMKAIFESLQAVAESAGFSSEDTADDIFFQFGWGKKNDDDLPN